MQFQSHQNWMPLSANVKTAKTVSLAKCAKVDTLDFSCAAASIADFYFFFYM